MNREELFKTINQRIISSLEQGVLPWRKPWTEGVPKNYVSKREYNGINFLNLSCENVSSPYFLTFFQAVENKMKIKKGSKGRLIVYYKIHSFIASSSEELVKCPLIRYSHVFNLDDIERYIKPQLNLQSGKELLEKIITNHHPDIRTNLRSAFYNQVEDYISVPSIASFTCEEEYFSTLFHELVHWSGHDKRMNRCNGKKFGDESYCFEELVAEIGSSYLAGMCGFQNVMENSSSYLNSWLKEARKDSAYLITSSVYAHKAVNYLLDTNPNQS